MRNYNKKPLTNRELFSYSHQIGQMQKQNSVLAYLNKDRINIFFKENDGALKTLEKHIRNLEGEFFELEVSEKHEDGSATMHPKQVDGKPVFLTGKTEFSFNKNWARLMNQIGGTAFVIEHYAPEPVESTDQNEPKVVNLHAE